MNAAAGTVPVNPTKYLNIVELGMAAAQHKAVTLAQEMTALYSVNTGVTSAQGNAGLAKSAAYLFDPTVDFYTVIQATTAAATNLNGDYTTLGYAPYMNNNDVVSSLETLLHGSTLP